jgi:hypothetical protein
MCKQKQHAPNSPSYATSVRQYLTKSSIMVMSARLQSRNALDKRAQTDFRVEFYISIMVNDERRKFP